MTEQPERARPPKPDPAPVLYAPGPEREPTGPARVETRGSALLGPRDAARRALQQDRVPERLTAKDPALWGPDAEAEAKVRLGWIDLPHSSRELLPRLAEVAAGLKGAGLTRVVLCGMGGSSLAPEVICAAAGAPLVVLDTTDPHQVARALDPALLGETVFVVSSKSGGTIETDCHLRLATAAAGWDHVVVVTDPDSPLSAVPAREVFLADPDVGGRYSALSAFGLVPAALAGVDVARLLDDATSALVDLAADDGNPGLDLGAALGGCGAAGRDQVVLAGSATGFGDWAEQLVAESTGKEGKGLLPVVVEGPDAPGTAFTATGTVHVVRLDASAPNSTSVTGPLGAAFLAWEYAVAVAGRVLGINPFDQPNVAESKANTQRLLDTSWEPPQPDYVEGAIEVHGGLGAATVAGTVEALLAALPATGYLAVLAYLDRLGDTDAALLRARLAQRTKRPVTFGWGPRYLHSTGQYHKGGPQVGGFLVVTGAVAADVEVPDRPFTLGTLQLAQALGDLAALRDRGRPAVRLHLTDRAAGLAQLLDLLPELAG